MDSQLTMRQPISAESITAAPHPEEMKASVDLVMGNILQMRATYRATPAGLIAVAFIVAAATLPWVWLAVRQTAARQSAAHS
jgi:hypothetical protein